MIYYLLLLIAIILTYVFIEVILKPKNKKIIFLNIAFLEMLVFLGIRDVTIGTDLKNYIPYFQSFSRLGWEDLFRTSLEPGYIIFNKIIGYVGGENFFLFVTAIVCLIGVYISIRKYSKDYFFSIFIYISMQFYIFLFSGLRQSIAFSLVWISLIFIQERKLFKFLGMILLAITFHKSAVIFLPMYFIATKKITLKYVMAFLVVLFTLFLLKGQLFYLITKYIYSNYEYSQGGGFNYLLLLLGIFLCLLLIRRKKKDNFRENDIWFNMFMMAILIQSLASVQGNIARLTMYFSYSMVFLIPNVLADIEDNKQRILIKGIVYLLLFIFFLGNIQTETVYIPYKTFF